MNYAARLILTFFGAGGRNAARYCASKARSAPSTVIPKPAMPSLMFWPKSAIHVPERQDNAGLRTADGLPGYAAKYNSARCIAAVIFLKGTFFLFIHK